MATYPLSPHETGGRRSFDEAPCTRDDAIDPLIAFVALHPCRCACHVLDDLAIATAGPGATRPGTMTPELSVRELDVLQLVSAGLTNPEIAARLYLSGNTIKTYIRTSYRKIGVTRRTQAVSWGLRHGLGDNPDA